MKKHVLSFLSLLLAFSPAAWAHSLWLEPASENKLMLRFGEYDNKLREPSEKFQRLGLIRAETQDKNGRRDLSLVKEADGFAFPGTSPAAALLFRAENLPVRDPKAGQKPSRSLWFGRWIPSSWEPRKPALPLDAVPAGPKMLKAFSKSAPLPNAKAKYLSSTGQNGELQADSEGRFDLKSLPSGFYILTLQTQDTQPGTWEGKAYESVTSKLALSFALP